MVMSLPSIQTFTRVRQNGQSSPSEGHFLGMNEKLSHWPRKSAELLSEYTDTMYGRCGSTLQDETRIARARERNAAFARPAPFFICFTRSLISPFFTATFKAFTFGTFSILARRKAIASAWPSGVHFGTIQHPYRSGSNRLSSYLLIGDFLGSVSLLKADS